MIKFIIIVICVFFLLRILSRMFIVSTFGSLNKKMQDEMRRRQGQPNNQVPEGHITIDPSVKAKRKRDDQNDEYIDYEELK